MLRAEHLTCGDSASGFADVSFEIAAGDTVAMIADTPAASTLLRVVATLLPPASGRAWVEGLSVVDNPAQVRRRVWWAGAFVTLRDTSVGDFLQLVVSTRVPARPQHMNTVVERLGLDTAMLLARLDSEQTARLTVAATQLADQRVTLIDGTGTGEPLATSLWRPVLEDRRMRRLTTVIALPQGHTLTRICDRVFTFDRGRMTMPVLQETLA